MLYLCGNKMRQQLNLYTIMKLSEIFGKTISSYDSWNGDYKTLKVECITITDDAREIRFAGHGRWGTMQTIYCPIDKVDELMETGKASTSTTIDHCNVSMEWCILK